MTALHKTRHRLRVEIDLWQFLLWAYQRQQVVAETGRTLQGIEAALEAPRQAHSRDGVAAALRIAELGCHVDGGPAGALASRVHPDAEVLHAVVLDLDPAFARAIVEAASSGDPPERVGVVPHWRATGHGGEWVRVPVPAPGELPANRAAVLHRGRKCRRIDDFHFEIFEETALVWSGWCCVEEYPVTTAYVDLANAIHGQFVAAMAALGRALDGVPFLDHSIRLAPRISTGDSQSE